MVRFDKSGKIIQVDFFFQNRNLYKLVTEDQLMAIYKGIMKNCRLIDGIYRLPSEGIEAKECEPECQEYHPKTWDAVVKYFDSLEQPK